MSTNNKTGNMVLVWAENLGIYYTLGAEKLEAVKKADLKIQRGEYIAVTGLYGPARNSFLNVLGCLKKPEEGKYIFDYNDVSLLEQRELVETRKKKIGFIFPDYKLFDNYSIRQNIELPLDYMDLKTDEKQSLIGKAFERIGLKEDMTLKVSGLTEFQKHKVSLARAIVNEPLMLIACEPAMNINQEEASEYMDMLNSLNREGLSIILVTDRAQIARYARRSIAFKDGLIISDEYSNEPDFGREVCAACKE